MNERAPKGPLRALILSNQSLLCTGIEHILRADSSLEIQSSSLDAAEAQQALRSARPDVVIVDSDDLGCSLPAMVMMLLTEMPGIRLIGLSLHDNAVSVYRRDRWVVSSAADLLEAIKLAGK